MSDGSEDLRALTVDLEKAALTVQRDSYAALKHEAVDMKADWRSRVAGSGHLAGLERAVSFDMLPTGVRSVTAEVGYDQVGQGELGNIAEFGTSTQGPAKPAGEAVLKDGADRYTKILGEIAGDIL